MLPIKVSIVNYTNTLPFRWALKQWPLKYPAQISEDIPSECARKLLSGEVDLALVPVAIINQLSEYQVVTNWCIGANGPVDSVKLYASVPVHQIKRVILDYQSRTSVALTKLLLIEYWQHHVEFIEGYQGFENDVCNDTAAVIIGDRTFAINGTYAFEYDLAEHWKKHTGLPFVFAAWVSRVPLPQKFLSEFNEVQAKGVANITEAIQSSLPIQKLSESQASEYLTQRIEYTLDKSKQEAMQLFLSKLRGLEDNS